MVKNIFRVKLLHSVVLDFDIYMHSIYYYTECGVNYTCDTIYESSKILNEDVISKSLFTKKKGK